MTTRLPHMDMLGVIQGSDKCSALSYSWDYLRHYQRIFEPWRDKNINLIEIGVARGASLKIWNTFFTHANIVGIDIDSNCKQYADERIFIEIGSQDDPSFLYQTCTKYPPTIVIDDGSHIAQHIIFTFEHIFPLLQPGGLYIVEDMAFHFKDWWKSQEEKTGLSAPNYFAALARDRMANGTTQSNPFGYEKFILEHIDEIAFIAGAIVLRKNAPRDVVSALAYAEEYLGKNQPTWKNCLHVAEYIYRHNGPIEQAKRYIGDATRIGGTRPAIQSLLFRILEREGRLDEAAKLVAETAVRWPGQVQFWEMLARIEGRRGRPDAAADALRKAIALRPEALHLQKQLAQVLKERVLISTP